MFSELITEAGSGIVRTIAGKCFALASAYSLLLVFVLRSAYILECRVISSGRENRLVQPGNSHGYGFSPVWVRICLFW